MRKIFSPIVLFMTIVLLLSACATEKEPAHVHQYGAWQITSPATCKGEGLRQRSCMASGCYDSQTESIPAMGHTFGEWVAGAESSYRACSACGYREFQYHNGGADQNQGNNNLPNTNPFLAEYSNFDTFLGDCETVGANKILYNGSLNTFEVNFSDGTNTCDYYTVHIPSRVSDVKFSASTSGTPIQNLKLVIDDRSTDINVYFENILIESSNTIFESQTRNINVTVYMQGTKCSFEIAKATDGGNGSNKTDFAEAGGGQNGAAGVAAMLINGNCHFICSAQTVTIKGGDGGNGGNGGTVLEPHFGHGGWGGHGGNGANAIEGETLASVTVLNNASVSISGGLGGHGGSGGKCRGVTWPVAAVKDGDPGNPGSDGTSGCKQFIYG